MGIGKIILLVEDDPALRMALLRPLKRWVGGLADIVEKPSADAGWEYLQTHRPDLILTDVDTASNMTGIDMIRELRKKEAAENLPHVPAIVQSGLPVKEGVDRQATVKALPGDNTFFDKKDNDYPDQLEKPIRAILGLPERSFESPIGR